MLPQKIDRRYFLTAPLRGGPPWTTKVRLVMSVPLIAVIAVIAGPFAMLGGWICAIKELVQYVAAEIRQAWRACDDETVRRLAYGDDPPDHPWDKLAEIVERAGRRS